MARQLVEKYIFTPGEADAGTLKFPGKCDLTQLLIVANKTNQTNMYALGDPTKNGTITYDDTDTTTFYSEQQGVSTLTFGSDTSMYLSSDKIAIYTDAPKNIGNIVRPYAFGVDAIERMRVANPQSLIDADFEYGLQPTKWQNYFDQRNIAGIYEKPGLDLFVTNVTTDGNSPSLITVTCSVAHGLTTGNPIIVYGLGNTASSSRAEGSFVINSTTTTTLTYYAKGIVGTNALSLYSASTYARRGGFYTGAALPTQTFVSNGANPSVITVTCSANHGIVPGCPLVGLAISTGTNHLLLTGNFYAESVPSPTTFTFTARVGGIVQNSAIAMALYTRSDAFVLHRPFDGGVQLGNFVPTHGASVSRQTKKYMRYQSGKGLFWSSGVLFNPVINLDQISAAGTTTGSLITVTTEIDHGLQVGCTVEIGGVLTSGYNGTYGVNSIISETVFTIVAASVLGSASAVITSFPRVTCTNWSGSTVRCGAFDEQNGVFWEYDGRELAVVKRSSTYQLSGFITVTASSQAVTGANCRFTQQLKQGDNIVIRGMTYKVGTITDDNTMTINPEYRGVSNATSIKYSLVYDQRVPQSQFNYDKLDGTGFSGFNVKLNKMQMMGISYSWYGAGFIDFMMRGSDGNFVLAHRMKQNNVNDEAYMRTGNMSVRYQVKNESAVSTLATNINDSYSTGLTVADASRFPTTGGTVLIESELINYTGISGNTLTGLSRSASMTQFVGGKNQTFTAGSAASHSVNNQKTAVWLVSCTASPTICHWGSSYIIDGGFDIDRGYYFSYASLNQTIPTGDEHTVFFIRLAPAVSNSISGNLGERDLVNRSQLLLQKLQVQSNQSVQVYGILNPGNIDASSLTWTSVNTVALGSQPSFAQIAEGVGYAAEPGEQIFSTLGQPDGFSEIDLSSLKELSNSSIGGYANYPDGPDVLGIVVKNLTIGTTVFNVTKTTTDASSKYRINGYNNPTLTVYRGQTYTINVASGVGSGHPLWIKTTQTTGTGDAYNVGLSDNGLIGGESLTWTVDIDAPDTLYYNCENHTADRGIITVLDRAPANVNVNLFWSEAQA
jgi:hypothetical protein